MNDYAQVYDDIDRDTEWSQPDPLPTGLPPVDPFDANLLPETLRPWIRDITERLQCPPDYPAIAAVVCLAAVVGRQIAIRPKKRDDWTVVPNLWGAVVGRPSTMKTPALAEIMRMIQRLEIEARQEYDEDRKQFDAAMMVADERQKAAKKAIRAAIKEGNDPGEIARASFEDTPEHPQRRRYISNDPTVEKLGELLATNPRGILVQRDELVAGFNPSTGKAAREPEHFFSKLGTALADSPSTELAAAQWRSRARVCRSLAASNLARCPATWLPPSKEVRGTTVYYNGSS